MDTAVPRPEHAGGRGGETDGETTAWGGGREAGAWTDDSETHNRMRQESKPMMTADTPSENANNKDKRYTAVLLQILGKKSGMKPQRNRQEF